MKNKKLDYTSAGVDIAAADQAKEKIKLLARETFNESVLSEIGSFGGFFRPNLSGFKEPVLVSSADGVGTKLKVAFMSGRHDTVGEDIVNHCINDILVHGARPLFFMDYIATGKLNPEIVAEIVKGLSVACRRAGMALIGGETAEMPDMYAPGEYDLAGFIVGIVDRGRIINGTTIRPGDVLIGLGSNGLHTNGYSLARKAIFEVGGRKHHDYVEELEMKVADALLLTHRCYLGPIMTLLEKCDVHGMAHITGGGIAGNLIRVIPQNMGAEIKIGSWDVPRLFKFIQEMGKISNNDMYPAFNMGIGYIIAVPSNQAEKAMENLRESGEAPYIIGEIVSGKHEVILKD
jgi:phosphoribosylformylglycinamidine cyclo-ligase